MRGGEPELGLSTVKGREWLEIEVSGLNIVGPNR